ncbi:MAG TPA: glycosyltransferase [Candidatus Atribacteria bacterium]|nr:glycosyltransferase [Candidatus Atribacteria bacterium]
MKVLFLSVNAGNGHNQTARAVMECLEEKHIECRMIDTFEYINPVISESINKGYLISTKLTPGFYGKLYRLAEKLDKSDAKLKLSKRTNLIWGKKLKGFIEGYNPDVVVCSHPFAAQVVTYMERGGHNFLTIGIVTDFTIHPFWGDTRLDYYVIANELLMHQAEMKGLDPKQLLPTGIPIMKKFASRIPAQEARAALGIEDKSTVLVMSGSMGYGNIVKIIEKLDEMDLDFQILSVCGRNKAIKKRIDNLEMRKKIYNYGFVNNVELMMDAADCILTKPGGLTVSECLAKGIPMVMVNPIPGQEDRNVEFLLNNGVAMKESKTFTVDMAVHQILTDHENTMRMKERISSLARPHAAQALCDFILSREGLVEAANATTSETHS